MTHLLGALAFLAGCIGFALFITVLVAIDKWIRGD